MYLIFKLKECKVTDCDTCPSSTEYKCTTCASGKVIIGLPFNDGSTLDKS